MLWTWTTNGIDTATLQLQWQMHGTLSHKLPVVASDVIAAGN